MGLEKREEVRIMQYGFYSKGCGEPLIIPSSGACFKQEWTWEEEAHSHGQSENSPQTREADGDGNGSEKYQQDRTHVLWFQLSGEVRENNFHISLSKMASCRVSTGTRMQSPGRGGMFGGQRQQRTDGTCSEGGEGVRKQRRGLWGHCEHIRAGQKSR